MGLRRGLFEGKWEWGLRQPSQRGPQRLCSQPGEAGGVRASRAPRCPVCRGLPWAPGASRALAHPSCALLGGRRALQADGGDAGDLDPRRAADAGGPQRRRISRAGSGGLASSSRMQDEACLIGASCGKAGRLELLRALPDYRPRVPRDPPPPSRPLPSTIFLGPLLSASQLLWQLGGTVLV